MRYLQQAIRTEVTNDDIPSILHNQPIGVETTILVLSDDGRMVTHARLAHSVDHALDNDDLRVITSCS
jgi:hypothetical protein